MRTIQLSMVVLLAAATAGCESQQVAQMSGTPSAPWESLQTFQGEPLMSVGYPKERGAWGEVKKALTAPSFEQALSAFEQSELPSDYSDKQAGKEAAVAAWRAAIEAAKSGSQDDLKAKVDAAFAAMNQIAG